jgi:hypothetical protein
MTNEPRIRRRVSRHGKDKSRGWSLEAKAAVVVLFSIAAAACDVTNPGPVADQDLNLPVVHESLVNGSGHELSRATGIIGYIGGVAAREMFPGGNSNDGFVPTVQAGNIGPDNVQNHWEWAHSARWIAEDAIRRFTELGVENVANRTFTQAHLWAGYANRLLGENFCDAVFDGGPAEPNIRYFERAEGHFTNGLSIAQSQVDIQGGHAGRAQVRVWLQDWAGAVSDAQQVPFDFVYTIDADGQNQNTRNFIYFASANIPYRNHSVWMTWHAEHYQETGDPRVPWVDDPDEPFSGGQIAGFGRVPYWFQQKYPDDNEDFNLSSGREMALIRAEGLLGNGQWMEAMELINSLRIGVISDSTGEPIELWVAGSLNEAWAFLKRERNIEMWMESRRLGDLRRWKNNQTPGEIDYPDYESIAQIFRDNQPVECYPIPTREVERNPNIS